MSSMSGGWGVGGLYIHENILFSFCVDGWCCYGSEFFAPPQLKYREESRKELSTNLFSTLAETPETKLARAVTELQSQVGGVNP